MKKKVLIILTLFFLALIIGPFYFLGVVVNLPKDFSQQEENTIFTIQFGQGIKEIAFNLKKEGFIKSRSTFVVYAILVGKAQTLQSGNYLLSPAMSPAQIVRIISEGNIIKERITIIEGWNLRDIGWYFEGRGMFQAEELFGLVGFPLIDYSVTKDLPIPQDFSQKFDFLADKPKNIGLEGYLFPDTYELNIEENLESIVGKMLSNFNRKLTKEIREEISRQEKSIFEVITMASLVEKEVKTLEDKKIVSGILWKRLEIGMSLQVDASVNYITGRKDAKVLTSETKLDSPYNTYKYRGLPFGPIANPGVDSIIAAVFPEESPYFYYLSTKEGETIFSKTLQEHNIAKAKYLK